VLLSMVVEDIGFSSAPGVFRGMFMNRLFPGSLVASLTLTAVLQVLAPRPSASADLRTELTAIAENIAALVKQMGEESITIGQFTGPPTLATSAGASIVQIFSEELKKHGILVKSGAKVGLKGEFSLSPTEDPQDRTREVLVLEIRGSIVNAFGKVLTEFTANRIANGQFTQSVRDEQLMVGLSGVTLNFPTGSQVTKPDRDQQFEKALANPTAHISGTKISATANSPYAVEILRDNRPLRVTLEAGLPVVDLKRHDSYQIRLVNDSSYDAAIRILIDGINTFHFSEIKNETGAPRYENYILPKHSSAIVKGWYRSNETVDSFLVSDYQESAARQLGHNSDLGTVSVLFSAAWVGQGPIPPDEPPANKGQQLATGRGPPIRDLVQETSRNIGVLRSAVSVRYAK